MTTFYINNDIQVFCVPAPSFPKGVQQAFVKLQAIAPMQDSRTYYGISRSDETGAIQYKAAANEVKENELTNIGLEIFTIREGNYLCIDVPDFMKNLQSIEKSFDEMLKDPRKDPNGYCLEMYLDDDLCKCLVPMKK